MLLGKHVYGQKPLAHNLHETRRMTELARERGLVTQMGIQIHSGAYYRGAVQLLKAGAIGKVREVHSWCFKHWGDRAALPNRRDTAPPELDWDLWLGVREARPYIGGDYYHPENWRKRLDFGVGTLGDMACHIFDPVFNALALGAPVAVRSDGPAPNKTNWALDAKVALTFAGTEFTAGKTLKLTWYDGDARPPAHITRLIEQDVLPEGGEGDTDGGARPRTRITRPVEPNELPEGGSIFVGTDGVLFLQHIRPARLFPTAKFADFKAPRERSLNHWASFVEAVRGNGQTTAGFDFAGPLTEAVLLGGVASRFPGEDLPWDTKALKFGNAAANQYVREPYRKGWEVAGL
jgi:predicted dehydrogenase